MRGEGKGTRHTVHGLRVTEKGKVGRKFHMEHQKMGKEGKSSTWNKQKARKNHLEGGGFSLFSFII